MSEKGTHMPPLLVAIAAADAILTAFKRVNEIIQARRQMVGELTPEEEAAVEAYEERRFAGCVGKRAVGDQRRLTVPQPERHPFSEPERRFPRA